MPPSAGQRTADFTGQESIVSMLVWMRACCNRLAVSGSLCKLGTDASQPAVYKSNNVQFQPFYNVCIVSAAQALLLPRQAVALAKADEAEHDEQQRQHDGHRDHLRDADQASVLFSQYPLVRQDTSTGARLQLHVLPPHLAAQLPPGLVEPVRLCAQAPPSAPPSRTAPCAARPGERGARLRAQVVGLVDQQLQALATLQHLLDVLRHHVLHLVHLRRPAHGVCTRGRPPAGAVRCAALRAPCAARRRPCSAPPGACRTSPSSTAAAACARRAARWNGRHADQGVPVRAGCARSQRGPTPAAARTPGSCPCCARSPSARSAQTSPGTLSSPFPERQMALAARTPPPRPPGRLRRAASQRTALAALAGAWAADTRRALKPSASRKLKVWPSAA